VVDATVAYAGRALPISSRERCRVGRSTGHRTARSATLLSKYDILSDDPEAALELYFQQLLGLVDLPRHGADGRHARQRRINPVPGERAAAQTSSSARASRDGDLRQSTNSRRNGSTASAHEAKAASAAASWLCLPEAARHRRGSRRAGRARQQLVGAASVQGLRGDSSSGLGAAFQQPPRRAVETVRARYHARRRALEAPPPARARTHCSVPRRPCDVYERRATLRFRPSSRCAARRAIRAGADTLQFPDARFKRCRA